MAQPPPPHDQGPPAPKGWQRLVIAAGDHEQGISEPGADLSLGGVLRTTREQQGFTIPEVAARIRVRAVMLTALEQDDYAALPAPIYVTGFLRSYGTFLGLDPQSLIGRYRDDSNRHQQRDAFVMPPIEHPARHVPQWLVWLCLILLLVIVTSIAMWRSEKRNLADLIPSIPDRLQEPVTSQPSPVAPAARIFGTNGDTRLVLHAHGQSWVEIRDAHGSLLLTRVLQDGDQYRVPPDKPGLRLNTGDAGMLDIELDGVVRDRLGQPGTALRDVDLTPEAMTALLASRPAPIAVQPPPEPQTETEQND